MKGRPGLKKSSWKSHTCNDAYTSLASPSHGLNLIAQRTLPRAGLQLIVQSEAGVVGVAKIVQH